MHACLFLILCAAGDIAQDAQELAAEFRGHVEKRRANWADPDERDHVAAVRLLNQLKSMGRPGETQLRLVVAPLLARDFQYYVDDRNVDWSDPEERDHVAVRRIVEVLLSLGRAGEFPLEDIVAPTLAEAFRYHAVERKIDWSDPDEGDHVAALHLIELLQTMKQSGERQLAGVIAPVLANGFVYHTQRRNPNWGNPAEDDHAAAVHLAKLLHSLGPAGYSQLGSRVLPILTTVKADSIQKLVSELSKASLRGIVVAIDFDTREFAVQDGNGEPHTFKVGPHTVIQPGSLRLGAIVEVQFDQRDWMAYKVTRPKF